MPSELKGLTSREAARRLAEHGPNELAREQGPSPWALLAGQFKGAMIWLLLAAYAVTKPTACGPSRRCSPEKAQRSRRTSSRALPRHPGG